MEIEDGCVRWRTYAEASHEDIYGCLGGGSIFFPRMNAILVMVAYHHFCLGMSLDAELVVLPCDVVSDVDAATFRSGEEMWGTVVRGGE